MLVKKIRNFICCLLMLIPISLFSSCTDSDSGESRVTTQESRRIALVTDPIVAQAAFLTQAVEALAVMQSAYGFEARHIVANDAFEWTDSVREVAEQGYDLIIGVGWQAAEFFPIVHEQYPLVKFAVIDVKAPDDGIKSVVFNMAEGAYVLGVMIATALPNEEYYGYIGNYNDAVDFQYYYGFKEGIRSVNPRSEVLAEYAHSYNDADIVYGKAMELYISGVNFIAAMVSTQANEGVFRAVRELGDQGRDVYASGIGVDQTSPENPNIIAGLTKNTGIATTYIIKEFLNNKYTAGIQTLNFNTGGFDVLHVTDKNVRYHNKDIITLAVISVGKNVINDIVEGRLEVVVPANFR